MAAADGDARGNQLLRHSRTRLECHPPRTCSRTASSNQSSLASRAIPSGIPYQQTMQQLTHYFAAQGGHSSWALISTWSAHGALGKYWSAFHGTTDLAVRPYSPVNPAFTGSL